VSKTAAFLLSLLICAWISWPALSGPFLFDDFPNLEQLASLQGKLDWRALAGYMAQYESEPGRPLSMLSFVINDDAWPSQPFAFKYTNLMFHLLVGVLVFGLTRSLSRLSSNENRANLIALLVMAAWLLHPMQLSTSMLVVQRMTQLSALFAIAGIWGYVALASRSCGSGGAITAVLILGVGTVLAVLCKETGALTPLLAVIINATLLRKCLDQHSNINRRLLHFGALLPVVLLVAAVAWRWNSLTGYSNRDFGMAERLLTQSRALCSYLYRVLLPNLRGGGIYHDDFLASRSLFDPWTTLPALATVVGLILCALILRTKRPVLSFGVLWFFAGHLLESSVFPLELYFEHRNYLPMFGPLFVLAHLVVTTEASWRRLTWVLAIFWITFSAWLTAIQAPIWGDLRKLTAVWAIEHPRSPRSIQQRADYLSKHYSIASAAEIMLDGYGRGVRGSDFPLQVLNLACANQDEPIAARAWPLVKDSLSTAGFDQALLATIAKLRLKAQRNNCPSILTDEQWLAMTTSLLANPEYTRRSARKFLHVERSYLFQHRRDFSGTMNELEAAWAADQSPDLAQLIAATLASAGLYDEAIVWADLALDHQVKGFRGLLSKDDIKSLRLKEALEAAKARQQRQTGE